MVLCGTKNGSSMASLEEPFEAPLFVFSFVPVSPLFASILLLYASDGLWMDYMCAIWG